MQEDGCADTDSVSFYRSNERFGEGANSSQKSKDGARIVLRRVVQEVEQVVAGREASTRAMQNCNTHGGVIGGVDERVRHSFIHLQSECVLLFGTVQCNAKNAIADGDAEMVAHGCRMEWVAKLRRR